MGPARTDRDSFGLAARRPSAAVVILSAAGLIAAVWLAMCLGQAGLAGAGLA